MAKNVLPWGAILSVALLAAYWLNAPPRAQQSGHEGGLPPVIAGLVVDQANLDLGELWEEKDFRCKIPITNLTDYPIEIFDFVSSSGCCMPVSCEPRQLKIAAGQTAQLELRLGLAERGAKELGMGRRPLRVEVSPVLRVPEKAPASWVFTGIIKSRVTLDAQSLSFGDSPAQGEAPVTRKVVATAHVPLQSLKAKVRADMVTVRVVPHTNGTQFDLLISPVPSLPPGKFSTDLTVHILDDEGQDRQVATLPVFANVQPEIRAFPARLYLPSAPVGMTTEGVLVLQARMDVTVIVEKIETELAEMTVTPIDVPGTQAGRAFRVVQSHVKEGDQTSTVRFTVRRAGAKAEMLAIEISCYGDSLK